MYVRTYIHMYVHTYACMHMYAHAHTCVVCLCNVCLYMHSFLHNVHKLVVIVMMLSYVCPSPLPPPPGMMETVRIRRSGYPVRRTFEDFLFRYSVLGRSVGTVPEPKAKCVAILKQYQETSQAKDWQPGHTKVRGRVTYVG